jgi:hypothetical protein
MKIYEKNTAANSLIRIISDAILCECALARQTRSGQRLRSLDYFLLVDICTEGGHLCYSSKIMLGYSMNDAIAELQALEGIIPEHASELSWRLKEYSSAHSSEIRFDIQQDAIAQARTTVSTRKETNK